MSNEFKQGNSGTTPAAVNGQNNPTQGVATPQQKTVGRVQGSTPSGTFVLFFDFDFSLVVCHQNKPVVSGSISNSVTTQSVAPQFAVATPHNVTHNANPEVFNFFLV